MFINFRYPTEYKILASTIAVMIVATLAFTFVTLGIATIPISALFVGFVLNYIFIRTKIEGLKRSAVRVGTTQFPEIKAIVDETAQRLGISPDTEVFVSYSPVMNAFAVGVGRPYSIVLYSALVESLDYDELRSVIGHEMGHIKFGHTTLLTLVGQLGSQTFGIPLIGDIIRYMFLFWMRATEFTADRAGLVSCGNLGKAIATEIKLGVGPELAKRVDLRELARQARESEGSVLGMLGEMEGTHPMMTTRIQKMVEFGFSDIFRKLRPDIQDISFQGTEYWQPASSPANLPSVSVCPNCGKPAIGSAATFCMYCGTRLLNEPQKCSHCHTPAEKGWKVCPSCGNQLIQQKII